MRLTIGIPVYNGEKHIEETILSILRCSFDWNNVEVIISDNCSTDNTCEIVRKYPQIRLFEHTQNLGYDKNVDRIFEYALGDYVWTIGADDYLVKEDVTEISNLASIKPNFSVIFIGESNTEFSGKSLDANTFLIQSNFRSGFLSNNIINRLMYLDSDRKPFIGSAWIHYAIILQVLKKADSTFSKEKYVSEIEASKNEKAWGQNGTMIFTGLQLVDIFSLMGKWGYDRNIIRRSKMVIKGAYPRLIILSKIAGFRTTLPVLGRFIKLYKEFFTFWVIDFWVLLTPSIILKFGYFLFRKTKKNNIDAKN